MSKQSQYQRGVVVTGKNTPLTETRRKLPQKALTRFLSFTATNSERSPNWPSICRHGWAGAFENSIKNQKQTNKQKIWPKGMWWAFWWAFYQNDDHNPTGGHHFGMMTMVVIWWPWDDHQNDHGHHLNMMTTWSSCGHHFTIVFDTLMTMGLLAWAKNDHGHHPKHLVAGDNSLGEWPPNDDHQKWRPQMMTTTINKNKNTKNSQQMSNQQQWTIPKGQNAIFIY